MNAAETVKTRLAGPLQRAVAVLALCALCACRGDGAKEMFDTAQFEELQNNPAHARQLYDRLVHDYPESPYAAQARTRLEQLPARD